MESWNPANQWYRDILRNKHHCQKSSEHVSILWRLQPLLRECLQVVGRHLITAHWNQLTLCFNTYTPSDTVSYPLIHEIVVSLHLRCTSRTSRLIRFSIKSISSRKTSKHSTRWLLPRAYAECWIIESHYYYYSSQPNSEYLVTFRAYHTTGTTFMHNCTDRKRNQNTLEQ